MRRPWSYDLLAGGVFETWAGVSYRIGNFNWRFYAGFDVTSKIAQDFATIRPSFKKIWDVQP